LQSLPEWNSTTVVVAWQFASYIPDTAMPEAKWEEEEEAQKHLEEFPAIDSKQRTISDFIN
jgi:hypothetical protein